MYWIAADGPSRTVFGANMEQRWVALDCTVRAPVYPCVRHALVFSGSPLQDKGKADMDCSGLPQQGYLWGRGEQALVALGFTGHTR